MGILDKIGDFLGEVRDFNPVESVFGNWTSVDSSNVSAFRYDAEQRLLQIKFHSGRIYGYKDVPENVVEEFASADSKGKFIHHNIKNNYSLA
jgi:KTSC domain